MDKEIKANTGAQRPSVNKSLTAKNEITSSTTNFLTKSSQKCKMTQKVFQVKELHLKPLEPANAATLHCNLTENGLNANPMQKPAVAPFNASATTKIVGTSKSAKTANCDVTTSITPARAGSSCQVVAHKSNQQTSSSSCSTPIANHKTRSKSAATTTKRSATSSYSSVPSKLSKNSDPEVKFHTARMPPSTVTPGKDGVTEAPPNILKKSVQTNTDYHPQCTTEAPHSTSQASTISEKSPANQPPCDSVSKPTKTPEVGK